MGAAVTQSRASACCSVQARRGGLAASGFSGFVDYEPVAGLDTITSQEISLGLRYEARFR
jgi:hypothetical protein